VILWEFDPRTKTRYSFENGKLIPHSPFSGDRLVKFPDPIGTQPTYFVPHGESQTLSKNVKGVNKVYIRGTFPPRAMRLVRALYEYGFYESKPITFEDKRIHPLNFIKNYLLSAPQGDQTEVWGYSVQIEVKGFSGDNRIMYRFQTSHPPMEEWGGTRAYAKNVGIPLSIGAQLVAAGKALQKGVDGAEVMLPTEEFVDELRKRGIRISDEKIDFW
jgi:lysine 6-dehydrogenase